MKKTARISFVCFVTIVFISMWGLWSCSNSASDSSPHVADSIEYVSFPVHYRDSIEQLQRAGNYSHICKRAKSSIFSHERNQGTDTVKGMIIHFHGSVTADLATKWIDTTMFRFATIKELLTFGLQPDYLAKNNDRFIVGLGSHEQAEGDIYVPVLRGDDHSMRTVPWDKEWFKKHNTYFLVLNK